MSSLTSTTSSAIALDQVLTCAVIASGALILLLSLKVLQSNSGNAHTAAARRLQMVSAFIPEWRDSFKANSSAVLLAFCVPLILTFFAFVAYTVAVTLS